MLSIRKKPNYVIFYHHIFFYFCKYDRHVIKRFRNVSDTTKWN